MSDLPTWLVAAIALVIPGFGQDLDHVYNGYLEGEYVYVAPSGAGRIVSIAVDEGDKVFEGQLLIKLEDTSQKAALRAIKNRQIAHFESHRHLNPPGIVPAEPELDFHAPHQRG